MNEWRILSTLQEVAKAQSEGEEIESRPTGFDWGEWSGLYWVSDGSYRSRPAKKTKTVVLRECLRKNLIDGYYVCWRETSTGDDGYFVKWLDTPERIVEVEL